MSANLALNFFQPLPDLVSEAFTLWRLRLERDRNFDRVAVFKTNFSFHNLLFVNPQEERSPVINSGVQARVYLSPVQVGQSIPKALEETFRILRASYCKYHRHDLVAVVASGSTRGRADRLRGEVEVSYRLGNLVWVLGCMGNR